MSQLMQPASAISLANPRAVMRSRVFEVLNRADLHWCVLHGQQSWDAESNSDVDLLIDSDAVPEKLAGLLREHREEIGADVVLWLNDEAQYIVLAGSSKCGRSAHCNLLQLHVSTSYSLAGRVFYSGDEILNSRRAQDGFWSPSAAIEFGCVLVNRILKQAIRHEHQERLAELHSEDPAGCEQQASRFLGPESVRLILRAVRGGAWEEVRRDLPRLRRELLTSASSKPVGGAVGRWARRIRRWLAPPCGLHLVFLGPDGVGKSTVIDALRRNLSPIFLRDKYLTFAPSLLPSRFETPKPDGPHSLPPRSFPASLIKAGWWAVCYTVGYYATIHPALARAGLVINHRYLPDAMVDPKRYRYSGPQWILRALWRIAPKPHLLFVLDAPPDVIQARKREVAPEEIRRQRDAYRALAGSLPFAHVIDASSTVEEVVAEIQQIVLRYLSDRVDIQRGINSRRPSSRTPEEA